MLNRGYRGAYPPVLLLLLALTGCPVQGVQGEPKPGPPKPVSVSLASIPAVLYAPASGPSPEARFPAQAEVEAIVLYSDRSTNSDVVWAVSDPTVGVIENQALRIRADSNPGKLVVTVSAADDHTVQASSSVTVLERGRAVVEVD